MQGGAVARPDGAYHGCEVAALLDGQADPPGVAGARSDGERMLLGCERRAVQPEKHELARGELERPVSFRSQCQSPHVWPFRLDRRHAGWTAQQEPGANDAASKPGATCQ